MFTMVADFMTYDLFGMSQGEPLTVAVHFFVYDLLLISVLLVSVAFVISLVTVYLPSDRIAAILDKRSPVTKYFAGAMLGMITPFCSCSAVPLFMGLAGTGISIGTSCSFLIASPLINEIAVVLLLAMFGWELTLWYVASGLIIAVVAGAIIDRLKLGRYLDRSLFPIASINHGNRISLGAGAAAAQAAFGARKLFTSMIGYVTIAVAVGAIVHGYIPFEIVDQLASDMGMLAVPAAVLVGVPLYSGVATIIPIASTLVTKGVSMGTVVAFTMSVTALSFPEFIMLKRVMRAPLLSAFIVIVATGIIFVGYIIDVVKP